MSGNIVIRPENVATTEGRHVKLKCGIDGNEERIIWHYSSPGTNRLHQLFVGLVANTTFGPRFSVHAHNRNLNLDLNIANVHFDDGGTYICEESATLDATRGEIIIIGRL